MKLSPPLMLATVGHLIAVSLAEITLPEILENVTKLFSDKIEREQETDFTDEYFSSAGQTLVTVVNFIFLLFGLFLNTMVLIFFYTVVDTKPIQSSLWINLSVCYLVKCMVMLYSVVGDIFDFLSNTEDKCRIRFALPLSMDIVCISCYFMILLERTIAIHCPAFYSVLQEHSNTLNSYCWSYGGCYFLFYALEFQLYDCPTECKTPFTHVLPVDSVQTISFILVVSVILAFLTSMFFLYPSNYSKVEKIRLQMEMNGTYLVIGLGTAILALWIPRQILIILFWMGKFTMAKYTIAMTTSTMFLESSVMVPFVALLTTNEFRTAAYCMFTMTSMRPLKSKLMAQESYKRTIRKLVEAERKASSDHKDRNKITSFSNRSTGTSLPDRQTETPHASLLPDPHPRNDFYIGQDLVVTPALDT